MEMSLASTNDETNNNCEERAEDDRHGNLLSFLKRSTDCQALLAIHNKEIWF